MESSCDKELFAKRISRQNTCLSPLRWAPLQSSNKIFSFVTNLKDFYVSSFDTVFARARLKDSTYYLFALFLLIVVFLHGLISQFERGGLRANLLENPIDAVKVMVNLARTALWDVSGWDPSKHSDSPAKWIKETPMYQAYKITYIPAGPIIAK